MRPDPRDGAVPDRVRLTHMLAAARESREFLGAKSSQELAEDRFCLLAVVKAIEIVGEAARCVTDATRNQLPEIPWELVVGMRHRVVHVYFNIDADVVWKTITYDIPQLILVIERHLASTGEG